MKKYRYYIIIGAAVLLAAVIAVGIIWNQSEENNETMEESQELTAEITAAPVPMETTPEETEAPEPQSEETLPNEAKETVKGSINRCVGYFTSWSAYARGLSLADVDVSLLTHLNFAFANLSQDGTILVGDSWADTEMPFFGQEGGHFGQIPKLKERNPDLKLLLSVGGWTWSRNFSEVAASDEGRARFAQSAVDMMTKYGFDGLDIDWEYPVEGGDGIPHRADDGQNYIKLLETVRKAFDEQGQKDGGRYLLSIAGGANPSFVRSNQIKEMMRYLDYINIMAYDYHGAWENKTGHNAPLYASDGLSVAGSVKEYLAAGAEPGDLNIGLAFYGRGWTSVFGGDGLGQSGTSISGTGLGLGTWEGGAFDYWDLTDGYVNKNGFTRYFDESAKVPYLYNGTTFITYDDEESIRAKLDFALDQKLGGVMFWEFSGDKKKVLQRVISEYRGPETRGQTKTSAPEPDKKLKEENEAAEMKFAAWESQKVYNSGDEVEYNGGKYRAKWWTQGDIPEQNCEEWGPWLLLTGE